jgi:hypothetical protein
MRLRSGALLGPDAPAALPHDVLVRVFSCLPRGALAVTPGRVSHAWAASKAEAWAAVSATPLTWDERRDLFLPPWYLRETYDAAPPEAKGKMRLVAVAHGFMDVVEDLHAADGFMDVVEDLYAAEPESFNAHACYWAAKKGQLPMLAWLVERGVRCDKERCADAAARGGHLHTLTWLVERGAPLDEWTCHAAAACGQLECLAWLRERGVKWDRETSNAAAECGQLHVLKFCKAHGCPMDEGTCRSAADGGQLDCLICASRALIGTHPCARQQRNTAT